MCEFTPTINSMQSFSSADYISGSHHQIQYIISELRLSLYDGVYSVLLCVGIVTEIAVLILL